MKCNIVRDLLPLYFDGLCSAETKEEMEKHFANCEVCSSLRQNLEAEQQNTEWKDADMILDKTIMPLKKVNKKMRRKNTIIALYAALLLILTVMTAVLSYGQISKTGISFELIYDAVRMRHIGEEFASGNIDPLYEIIADGYTLLDEESAIIRSAYTDREVYNKDMKETVLSKYNQYFEGKTLKYKGIEQIGYMQMPRIGTEQNKMLYICMKFEGDNQLRYYIGLYKTLSGQYLADDYFGNPYINYEKSNKGEETQLQNNNTNGEAYHTEDTLFSCLHDRLSDADLSFMRQMVRVAGKRALNGDDAFVKEGQMRFSIISEQDFKDGTQLLRDKADEGIFKLAKEGYYLTDTIWNVKEYDKTRHLYIYNVNLELTNQNGFDEISILFECYRVSDKFIYITGTDRIYGNNLSNETVDIITEIYK